MNGPWSDELKLGLTIHTGYTSFPNIYFGEEHVGGLDDLKGRYHHFWDFKLSSKTTRVIVKQKLDIYKYNKLIQWNEAITTINIHRL